VEQLDSERAVHPETATATTRQQRQDRGPQRRSVGHQQGRGRAHRGRGHASHPGAATAEPHQLGGGRARIIRSSTSVGWGAWRMQWGGDASVRTNYHAREA
jgi:hypothetical protein